MTSKRSEEVFGDVRDELRDSDIKESTYLF
jgi:hypothetical protein